MIQQTPTAHNQIWHSQQSKMVQICLDSPSIEYNGRKKIDEEKIFAENHKTRALSFSGKQNYNSSAQTLHISAQLLLKQSNQELLNFPKNLSIELTMARAVMDSFIHLYSSNKWPTTIQAQRSATNRFMDTTEE